MAYAISVVIPSYNSEKYIYDCLSTVFSQKTEYRYEVIVVDSSEEDITARLKSRFPEVKTVHLSHRTYPGTARNIGVENASAEVIAFTDADCLVGDNWIQKFMENQRAGREVVGGPVGNGTPKNIFGTVDFLLEFNELLGGKKLGKVGLLGTGNTAYRRSLLEKYGGFEDTIKGSDSILSRKMAMNGVDVYLDPEIKMYHRNRTSLRKVLKNQYDLGIGSAHTRSKVNIRGSILLRMPLLIPLIPLLRTVAIGRRLYKNSMTNCMRFVALYPFIFLGLVVFTAGFARGVKTAPSGKGRQWVKKMVKGS